MSRTEYSCNSAEIETRRLSGQEWRSYSRFTAFYCAVYFTVATTKVLSFWKTGDGNFFKGDLETGKELLSAIGVGVLLLCLRNIYKKNKLAWQLILRSWPLIAVMAFAMASMMWSQIPSLTLKRYMKLLILFFCLLDLITEKDNHRALKMSFLWYIGTVVVLSLLVMVVLPQYGWMIYAQSGKLVAKGIIAHKSELGEFCASSVLVLLWILYSTPDIPVLLKKRIKLLIIGSLLLLALTQGKNPLLNLIFSLSLFYLMSILYRSRNKRIVLAMFFFSCCCGIVFVYLRLTGVIGSVIEYVVLAVGKDMTFTGRTDLWNTFMWLGFQQNPFIGSGYGAFFGGSKTSWLLDYIWDSASSAHSGYLQLFLELGFLGLGLFVLFLIWALRQAFSPGESLGTKEKSVIISIIWFNIFYNIVSVSFLSYRMSFIGLMFAVMYLPSRLIGKHNRQRKLSECISE
ncbi:MAG: O-antigen ligase family protein [Chitinispirillaceae bacterium]